MSACVICDGPVPPGQRGERQACDRPECRSAFNQWCVSHAASVRRARAEALRGERECSDCGETFPLDADHFPISGRRDGRTLFRRQCRPCWRIRAVAHSKRRWERVKADPERHARDLEADRIRHALKRERETGAFPAKRARTAKNAHRDDVGRGALLLPLEPIGAWLDAVVAREIPDYGLKVGDGSRHGRSRTIDDLAAELRISPRRLSAIHSRQQAKVAFTTIDKAVTNYDGMVTGEQMAQALAERCQALPGNGERLLRYIDLAERIAHLADGAVYRPADLYPELG